MLNAVLMTLLIAGGVLFVAALWLVSIYNGLTISRNQFKNAFAQIDVQLKRRYDLIPNLVESVKGYAAHERGTFDEVTAARTAAVSASGVAAQGQAEGALNQALGRLFAVAEAYPDLKANQNFLQLQGELTATEDRLQAARRFYNTTVKALNTACVTIPSRFVAPIAKVTEREFFELENPAEAAVPQVSFNS